MRTCQPRVSVLPRGRKNPTRPSGSNWMTLAEKACVTSNVEVPFSADGFHGSCGRVCRITPAVPNRPPSTALLETERRSVFDHQRARLPLLVAGLERNFAGAACDVSKRELAGRRGRGGVVPTSSSRVAKARLRLRPACPKCHSTCRSMMPLKPRPHPGPQVARGQNNKCRFDFPTNHRPEL